MRWSPAPLLALVVAGCGHATSPAVPPAPPPPDAAIDAPVPLDQDLPRLAERALVLYEDVAAAFARAGEDCAAAAAALHELAARHAEVIAANAKVLREGRGAQLELALRHLQDRLDAAARAIVQGPTLAACAQDPAFEDAYDAMFGGRP